MNEFYTQIRNEAETVIAELLDSAKLSKGEWHNGKKRV